MAFTNVYDVTFPPDTQLANQLGLDLRNFRLDTQQRMASISGLDASKPNFAGDAQPNNWNGVLFFATDTGKIYQFNNPAWTDLTVNFTFKNPAIKALNTVTQTGDTAQHTIYTLAIPGGYLGTTGQLRITVGLNINNVGGHPAILIMYGGNGISPPIAVASIPAGGISGSIVVVGGNLGATNSQSWDALEMPILGSPYIGTNLGHRTTAIDSTVNQNLTVTFQGSANADVGNFYRCLVELL